MATNHRMFSNTITQSARFLRMPLSTQALYFHLGMQADDDGVVEAFTVMRLVGAMEDDLRVLAGKGFVTILNDDLVSLIMDWNTNNVIRKERYKPSIYSNLLLQLNGLEPGWHPNDTQPAPKRHPNGTQTATIGSPKTRQDKIRQDKTIQAATELEPDPLEYREKPDELVIYATQNLTTMNARSLDELISYRDVFTDDMIKEAIDETLKHGSRAYAYTHSILERWRQAGYKTVAEVNADADKRKAAADKKPPAKGMIQRAVTDDEFGADFYWDPTRGGANA